MFDWDHQVHGNKQRTKNRETVGASIHVSVRALRFEKNLAGLEILKLSGAFEDARTAPACAVMERQVHHLNRLVDDLLEVSRITRGIIEVKKEPLDLAAIVRAAIETSRPVLDNLRHEIRIDFEPSQICVGGDPVRRARR